MALIAVIFVILGVLGLGMWPLVRRGRSEEVPTADGLVGRIEPVDLAAFLNLLDPAESEYLRQRLPGPAFRRLHRLRVRVAIQYYWRIAGNAAVFLRLGEACGASPDSAMAEAGRRLAETAMAVRVAALRSILLLAPAYAWPTGGVVPAQIAEPYLHLKNLALAVGRLQGLGSEAAVAIPN